MRAFKSSVLAVIGAGPKGIAVAVKAKVLAEFGIAVDRVILIEKNGIAAHWSGNFGYTNGEMKLGTSPEKDVVFPLETEVGDERLNHQIRQRLMDFTWVAFLVHTQTYSDWVDRGRLAPSHQEWAQYLLWVSRQLGPEVTILAAKVAHIDVNGGRWELKLVTPAGEAESIQVDRLMLTGPGKSRTEYLEPNKVIPRLYDVESFWEALKKRAFNLEGRIAVVGAGENAASVLLGLAQVAPHLKVDLVSPKGFISTRAENFYENRFYSQPEKSGWEDLAMTDRLQFIDRTDLGVFSVHAMQILNEQVRHHIVPGRMTEVTQNERGISLTVNYHGIRSQHVYDSVILATGFDHVAMLRSLLSPAACAMIEEQLGESIRYHALALRIGADLSVKGVLPALHLPMLAGVMHGPGFSNLSCLGKLADRVLLSQESLPVSIEESQLLEACI